MTTQECPGAKGQGVCTAAGLKRNKSGGCRVNTRALRCQQLPFAPPVHTALCPMRLTCPSCGNRLPPLWLRVGSGQWGPCQKTEGRRRVRLEYFFLCLSPHRVISGWLHPQLKAPCSCQGHLSPCLPPSRFGNSVTSAPSGQGDKSPTGSSRPQHPALAFSVSLYPAHTFVNSPFFKDSLKYPNSSVPSVSC